MWRFSIFLFTAFVLIAQAPELRAQRIPADYGRSSPQAIPSGNRIPSGIGGGGLGGSGIGGGGLGGSGIGGRGIGGSGLGGRDIGGGGIGGGGIGGLSEIYEFKCSNCNKVIATGNSEFSAAHITSCKFCGVRFSNDLAGRNDVADRLGARPTAAAPSDTTRTTRSRRSKDDLPIEFLYFVIGICAVGATMIAIGGIVFMIVKEANRRSPYHGPSGNSPSGGNSGYSQPPVNNPPWHRR